MKRLSYIIFLTSLIFLNACQSVQEQPAQSPTNTAPSEFVPVTHIETPTSPAPTRPTLNTPVMTPSPAAEKRVTLMAVGDMMLGRTIGER